MEHEELIRRFYEVFRTGDTSALSDILAADWVNHPADPGRSNDVAGFALGVDDLRRALHGLDVEIVRVVAQDDVIVCRIRVSGEFVNPFAGIEPTGTHSGFDAMDMHVVRGDRISETWHFEHLEQLSE